MTALGFPLASNDKICAIRNCLFGWTRRPTAQAGLKYQAWMSIAAFFTCRNCPHKTVPMTPESEMVSDPDSQIIFTSMGMVVLDEIQFPSGKLLKDVIGGSGAYSEPS